MFLVLFSGFFLCSFFVLFQDKVFHGLDCVPLLTFIYCSSPAATARRVHHNPVPRVQLRAAEVDDHVVVRGLVLLDHCVPVPRAGRPSMPYGLQLQRSDRVEHCTGTRSSISRTANVRRMHEYYQTGDQKLSWAARLVLVVGNLKQDHRKLRG